jgi:hypothetical protein
MRTAYEPSPETLAAMEQAMQLLDPDHPQSIAGWREVLTPEGVADLLDVTSDNARAHLRGQRTWTDAERNTLVCHMTDRHAAIAQRAHLSNAP